MIKKSYLALGDSYTIGEAVDAEGRFPSQLVAILDRDDVRYSTPEIVAVTGWTTDELISGIKDSNLAQDTYDMVSLLIGVNNQYRGYPMSQYLKEFEMLLQKALAYAGNDRHRVFVVTIPDWGVTPYAEDRDRKVIAKEIDEYNAQAANICKTYNVAMVDITDISRQEDPDGIMIASDGLHPSAHQYKLWASRIATTLFQ